jgi:hypothetical protein
MVALKPLLEQMQRKGDVLFLSRFDPLRAAALY